MGDQSTTAEPNSEAQRLSLRRIDHDCPRRLDPARDRSIARPADDRSQRRREDGHGRRLADLSHGAGSRRQGGRRKQGRRRPAGPGRGSGPSDPGPARGSSLGALRMLNELGEWVADAGSTLVGLVGIPWRGAARLRGDHPPAQALPRQCRYPALRPGRRSRARHHRADELPDRHRRSASRARCSSSSSGPRSIRST